jgi:hypothetical protein
VTPIVSKENTTIMKDIPLTICDENYESEAEDDEDILVINDDQRIKCS